MYVPQSLPFVEPMFALWRGRSGRTYEFAVLNPEGLRIAAPVVFVLARQRGGHTEALFVGHADHLGGDDGLRARWIAAREMGMTHVHASFDALWQPARVAQVEDLVAALSPPLNAASVADAPVPAPDAEVTVDASVAPAPAPSANGPRNGRHAATVPNGGMTLATDRAAAAIDLPPAPPVAGGGVMTVPVAQRRTVLPADRLWAIVRAAGRALERFVTRGRREEDTAEAEKAYPYVPARAPSFAPASSTPDLVASARSAPAFQPPALSEEPPSLAPADAAFPADAAAPRRIQEPGSKEAAGGEVQPMEGARARLGLPLAAPVILFAGHMAETSGIDILIDAIITVAGRNPDAYFVLVGSGDRRDAVEARIAAERLGSRCRFPGDLDRKTCHDYLCAADCVVVPAHAQVTDGFADAALAARKPVLTTHQAQLSSVSHGINGLIAYDNANSLVWGLSELLSMRAEHRVLFEAAAGAG